MKHYVCAGECGGVSEQVKACEESDCSKGKLMTSCPCVDDLHYEVHPSRPKKRPLRKDPRRVGRIGAGKMGRPSLGHGLLPLCAGAGENGHHFLIERIELYSASSIISKKRRNL